MKAIFTCLLFSIVLAVSAQQNTFKVRAFAPDYSYLSQVIQLNDGSFVGVGNAYTNSNEPKIYILKTDAKGNVLASKEVNIVDNIFFQPDLIKTSDGGFAICSVLYGKPGLIKFNADLTIQWQKNYTTKNTSEVSKLIQMEDGGYMLAGDTYSDDSLNYAALVIKTDSQGQVQFAKSYLSYAGNLFYNITATGDGNYALLGRSSVTNIFTNVYVVKIKPEGSVIWSKNFSNNGDDIISTSFVATPDSGLIITGETSPSMKGHKPIMIKYNNDGDLVWSKYVIMPKYSEVYADISVTEDRDGDYLYCGAYTRYIDMSENILDTNYAFIMKTNVTGDVLWMKTFEPNHDGVTFFKRLILTIDSGYAACGDGSFYNKYNNDSDIGSFINKFNNNFIACNEHPMESVVTNQNFGYSYSETIPTGDIAITDSAISISLVDFGTIDNVCSSTALPLQLLSFHAALQNKNIAVQWTTANEVNTSYFVVEKSKDAVAFTALQQVAAKGNSAGVQTYTVTDVQPLPGTSYYRLKEVDKDGKVTYSSVVPVTVLSNGTIIISPNPVQDAIKIFLQSQSNSGILLQITDMAGRILAAKNTYVTTGANTISLPAASLSKGVYILKVRQNNQTKSIHFLKE